MPIVTQGLIALNLAVYLTGLIAQTVDLFDLEKLTDVLHFDPQQFRWWQLLTSMFMHDPQSIWHLAFNMLFLWVFGAPVEDRLGRIGFLAFYLGGGVVACLGHSMASPTPVIGASGAIAAVTGAFLALFPRSHIIVLFLLGFGTFAVSSLWFIGLYFLVDVLRHAGSLLGVRSNVAYMAHIAGYLYGFGVAFILLGTGIIKHEEYDVFFLFTQARRRAAFRAANRVQAVGMWESAAADTGDRLAKRNKAAAPLSAEEARHSEMRAQINQLASVNDLAGAAAKYRELLRQAPDTVFTEQRQLDLANQLYAQNDHAHAAAAYELLLERYPTCARAAQVRLILGVMYTRQLNHPARAKEVIQAAKPSLHEPNQTKLAEELLAELHR
ncbi:MAG: rhomboid family intramembrane serine protease [Phycisphaerales bacterium]|nr:rhomboid family intramembrane serine protease [Phycisphaerales bacterium]